MTNYFTNNGDRAYEHSGNHLLEYFSKGGSFRNGSAYYSNASDPLEMFKAAWRTGDRETCMKLLFWTRDCRGGAGARSNFRSIANWLAHEATDWVNANIALIPQHGRWDDLKALYNTPCETAAIQLWADAIRSGNASISHLAAKWANRQDPKLRKEMGLSPKQFRKLLVEKTKWVVEHDMCAGQWEKIQYNKVPSVAMARYSSAFERHEPEAFTQYVSNVADNKAKINTKALFPHDVIKKMRTILWHEEKDDIQRKLVNAMFEKLPNYITDPNVRIMSIPDTSASMTVSVSGHIGAIDVALGLAMYCSDKIGKQNPFYRKVVPFSTEARLVSWADCDVVDGYNKLNEGLIESTNIAAALDLLLESAIMWNVSKDQMVNTLVILSDMQFNEAAFNGDQTTIEHCLDTWEHAGYDRPKIVYWNLLGYDGQPSMENQNDVAMISGFSPSILDKVLTAKTFTPVDIMLETLNKYNIVKP